VLLDYLRIIEINRAHCGPRGLALFAVLGRMKNGLWAATLFHLDGLSLSGSLSPRFAPRLKNAEGIIVMLEAAIVAVVTLAVMVLLYRWLEPKT
jgi:hypothetical protein